MSDPIRSSQVHLCRVVAIAIVGAFLMPHAAEAQVRDQAAERSLCTTAQGLDARVHFATRDRAQTILGHRDKWARQLSDFDLGVRQRTAEPTGLKEFLQFAAGAGRRWTSLEKAEWAPLVRRLSDAMDGLQLRLPGIELIKTSGREEFDAAYTRRHAVMFPESITSLPTTDPRGAYFLLAHEVFHVVSRSDSGLRDELYALLGFKKVDGFEYPAELEARRLSNPDAFEYLHTLPVESETGIVEVMPVIQSLLELNEVIQLPNIFDAVDIALLAVDSGTGKALRNGNGDLVTYNFGNTNWVPQMLRNSSYVIHPEEILADNFATLMEWRSDGALPPTNPSGFPANDVNLLIDMERALQHSCSTR